MCACLHAIITYIVAVENVQNHMILPTVISRCLFQQSTHVSELQIGRPLSSLFSHDFLMHQLQCARKILVHGIFQLIPPL